VDGVAYPHGVVCSVSSVACLAVQRQLGLPGCIYTIMQSRNPPRLRSIDIATAYAKPSISIREHSFLYAKPATALARLSHRSSVRPSIRHMGESVKNGASWDHQIFTVGCGKTSFRISKAFP